MTSARIETLHAHPRIGTAFVSRELTRVFAGNVTVGFVRAIRRDSKDVSGRDTDYIALKGPVEQLATEVGRYASHGLALEAVRQRRRSI